MGIPPIVGDYINSWANFLLFLYAPIATFMAAYSSSQPGFLAPDDPPIVKDATAKLARVTKAHPAVAAAAIGAATGAVAGGMGAGGAAIIGAAAGIAVQQSTKHGG